MSSIFIQLNLPPPLFPMISTENEEQKIKFEGIIKN